VSQIKCQTITGETIEVEESSLSLRPAAYALIVNGDNELLVEDPSEEGGKYWFPGGGLKDDEIPELALVREVKEETGLEIKVGQQIAYLEYYYYHNKLHQNFRCQSKFFLCRPILSIKDTSGEVKTKWLKLGQLDESKFHPLIVSVLDSLRKTILNK
jgi:8-oxo-dGTP diphosphatase